MNKLNIHFLSIVLIAIVSVISSCSSNSYSNQLKEERRLIKDFIKREGINIIDKTPEDGVWGEKDYLDLGDNLYFHLSKAGETEGDSINVLTSTVVMRYRRYTLTADADTLSYWTTNDGGEPITFPYSQTSSYICTGWFYAIAKMKYQNSEATIICPSKLGETDAVSDVTPYGYDLKLQFKNW